MGAARPDGVSCTPDNCNQGHCQLKETVQKLRLELREKSILIEKILSVSTSQSKYIQQLQHSINTNRSLSQTLPWFGETPAEAHSTATDSNIIQICGRKNNGWERMDGAASTTNTSSALEARSRQDLHEDQADAGPRAPALCSTPKQSWAEVTRRGRRICGPEPDTASSGNLGLTNRFAPLAEDLTGRQRPERAHRDRHRAERLPWHLALLLVPAKRRLPLPPLRIQRRLLVPALLEPGRLALLPGAAALAQPPGSSAVPLVPATRRKRRRLLKDAVARRSGELPRGSRAAACISPASGDPLSTEKPGLHAGVLSARKHQYGAPISPPEPAGAEAAAHHPAAVSGRPAGRPGPVQQPVLIVGDSVVRHVRVRRFWGEKQRKTHGEGFCKGNPKFYW
ncbi:uncharacterized protein LOC144987834 isoform X2 [Oryzias latipes]